MAGNPGFQVAYGMARGDKKQAEFNYRLLSLMGMGSAAPFESPDGAGGGGAPASMNPTAGLKAILPGARAKGGKVSKRKR
jgi:hypothetical protein